MRIEEPTILYFLEMYLDWTNTIFSKSKSKSSLKIRKWSFSSYLIPPFHSFTFCFNQNSIFSNFEKCFNTFSTLSSLFWFSSKINKEKTNLKKKKEKRKTSIIFFCSIFPNFRYLLVFITKILKRICRTIDVGMCGVRWFSDCNIQGMEQTWKKKLFDGYCY